MPQLWLVVGGGDRGGILVRAGQALTTEKLQERLSTGAVVAEIELVGEGLAARLHYRRVTGSGPEEGWIGIALEHKELARRLPPQRSAQLPRQVLLPLRQLLHAQISHAANLELSSRSSGERRTDLLEDAQEDAGRVARHKDAVRVTEFLAPDELEHLCEQAGVLGWEAATAASKGEPLAPEAPDRLEAPRCFAPSLWNRALKALLIAAESVCSGLAKDRGFEAGRLLRDYEASWEDLGAKPAWYAEAEEPVAAFGDEEGTAFRVVANRVDVRERITGGRTVGVLNRGTVCRGEAQQTKDGRRVFRLPRELNRDLLDVVKWQGSEGWAPIESQPLVPVGSTRDKGLVVLGCSQLYSHVKYFARLGEWLRERGHEVQLWSIATEKTRQAAEDHLPQKCLRLLGERDEDKGFWDIWEQVSREGNASDHSRWQFGKCIGYIQWYTAEAIKSHRPTMVVTDGFNDGFFNEACSSCCQARATVCPVARKDGFNDEKGAEPFPTLYPTVPCLFDGERHPTTIVCGPFLPPVEQLERTEHLEAGSAELKKWCAADTSRPLVYVSFGTVAVLSPPFLLRVTRALLDMCANKEPVAQEGEAEEPWLQLHETSCSEPSPHSAACDGSAAALRQCREICREEGFGGFCVSGGRAEFWLPGELIPGAVGREHAVLHFPAEATLGKRPPGSGALKPRFLWSLPEKQRRLLPPEAFAEPDLRIEDFVPQQAVLRLQNVAAVISHCGANSTHEALACGVPIVCVPFFMDQFDWTRAVVRRGLGVPLDRHTLKEQDICSAVEMAVARCTKGAERIGQEIRLFLRGGSGLDRAGKLCLRAMGYDS